MKKLKNINDLEVVIHASQTQPVLFFKHSPRCGVSHYARAELEKALQPETHRTAVYEIDVLAARPLSNSLSERMGIAHESPQALLVRGETCLWHGSHGKLTADVFQKILTSGQAGSLGYGLAL